MRISRPFLRGTSRNRPADDRTPLADVDLSVPPGRWTRKGLSHQPWTIAAAAAAAALETGRTGLAGSSLPHRDRQVVGPSGRTSWTLVRSGKRS